MAREDIPFDFRPNNLVERKRIEERENGEKKKVEREALPSLWIFRIGPSVSGEAKGKVFPRDKSYK